MSPWQGDRNVGACTIHRCREVGVPRCDAFMCQECCELHHSEWSAHRQPDGTVTRVREDATRPYRGYNTTHSSWCKCIACKRDKEVTPIEYDYDGFPPEFNEVKELGEDHERCFIPLSNYKANKDWPADYIG